MKSEEIREMTIAEIKERIENEKEMLLKLKINHHVSSLENPMKIKYARRTIARLKTEVTMRESEGGDVVSSGKKEATKKASNVSADLSSEAEAKGEPTAKKEEKSKAVEVEKVTSE